MTVSTSTNSVVYRGNGATTAFAVPFKVLDEDHLVVTRRVYATGALSYTYIGTDYSYSGIGADAGTLTLAGTALDNDYELVIERIVPYTQDLDIVNSGGFYPETVEEQLDLIVMGVQQLADIAGRSLRVPVGEEMDDLPRTEGVLTIDTNGAVVVAPLTVTAANGSTVTSRVLLAAISAPVAGQMAYLAESGREGAFLFNTADLSSFVTADTRQALYVAPASDTDGSSGAWVRVTNAPGWQLSWFGLVDGGVTSNHAAVQAAITLANYFGGARIEVPAGLYQLTNTPVDGPGGTGAAAQILWPNRSAAQGCITIELVGPSPPPTYDSTAGSGLAVHTTGAIFRSTATSGAVFGGDGTIGPGVYDQTAVKIVMQNLTVRVPDNPAVTAIHLGYCAWAQVEDVRVDTGEETQDITQPSNANGKGIVMPFINNGNQSLMKGQITAAGFYDAYWLGEHTVFENLIAFGSLYAAVFTGNNFPVTGAYFLYANCRNGLRFTDAVSTIKIDTLAFEHYDENPANVQAWMLPQNDIVDASNYARGEVNYHSVLQGVGLDTSATAFVRSGGYFLTAYPLVTAFRHTIITKAAAQTIPNTTLTALVFDTNTQDYNFAHSTSVENTKIIPKQYGTVTLHASVRFAANATGVRTIQISKNGTTIVAFDQMIAPASGTAMLSCSVTTTCETAGDYFEVYVSQTSGGNLDVEKSGAGDVTSPLFELSFL